MLCYAAMIAALFVLTCGAIGNNDGITSLNLATVLSDIICNCISSTSSKVQKWTFEIEIEKLLKNDLMPESSEEILKLCLDFKPDCGYN